MLRIGCVWLLALLPLAAPLAEVQVLSNSISYSTSTQFTEPGVSEHVTKHIVEYVHANRYDLGNNLFRAKIMRSGPNDPAESGNKGATELYVVYRHYLSFGALAERRVGFGPISDVGLTAGFDLNTKNNAFNPRKRLFVAGPTLRFALERPAMLAFSVLAAKEFNHCGLPPCLAPGASSDFEFDTFPMLHLAWRFPWRVGEVNTRIEGFAAKGYRQGTDYVGNDVGHETLMRVAWLADVGQWLDTRPNALFVGIGYELWRNKYGATGIPGTNTDAPTFHVKWHF
jgi:hypothetical protein